MEAESRRMGIGIKRGILGAWLWGCFSAQGWALCDTPWRVGYDQWPPYHFRGADATMQGYGVEVLQGVARRLGCEVTFIERPWKRNLQELELGELSIAMEAFINDERSRYAWFSEPYSPGKTMLWVRRDAQFDDGSLPAWLAAGHRLGITKEFYYGAEVANLVARYPDRISALVDESQNYGKLMRGRIDGFLGDALATRWALHQEGLLGKIVPFSEPIFVMPARFMMSKQRFDPSEVARFNQELAVFMASPEYDALLRRYFPEAIRSEP